MNAFDHTQLSSMVGEELTITDSSNDHGLLTIKDVTANKSNDKNCQGFSVLLEGNGEIQLPQGNYSVSHEKIDKQELFIVPVGPNEYEIIINQKIA